MSLPLEVECTSVAQLAFKVERNVVEQLPQYTVAEAIVVQIHLQIPAKLTIAGTAHTETNKVILVKYCAFAEAIAVQVLTAMPIKAQIGSCCTYRNRQHRCGHLL